MPEIELFHRDFGNPSLVDSAPTYSWARYGWMVMPAPENAIIVQLPDAIDITQTTAVLSARYTDYSSRMRLIWGTRPGDYDRRTCIEIQATAPETCNFLLQELSPGTTYYVRAIGEAYGPGVLPAPSNIAGKQVCSPEMSFTTLV